ncbi:MAG: RtcB family protein [Bacteroidales bacterium]|nr:RtcB family protein [Bacteroidales bacterium]
MIELHGSCCSDCKIFTDDVEPSALALIQNILDEEPMKDIPVRIMPDTHAGIGIVIGFTAPLRGTVNPSHIGVDIGCGVQSLFFTHRLPEDKYADFEKGVRQLIPLGFNIHDKSVFDMKEFIAFVNSRLESAYQSADGLVNQVHWSSEDDVRTWAQHIRIGYDVFCQSIGTLGGGNHFIEYDESDSSCCITIHTGSRNLGKKVHAVWSARAEHNRKQPKIDYDTTDFRMQLPDSISKSEMKNLVKQEVQRRIDAAVSKITPGYLYDDDLHAYLTDMVIAQAYASFNRKTIINRLAELYVSLFPASERGHVKRVRQIETVHNYLDFSDMIIRKGAVRAAKDELMVIPFNMRDGLALCRGLGNADWNCSAPHGSGRVLSRKQAQKVLSLSDFQESMKGIYTTTAIQETIDEAPMVYKPTDAIIEAIRPTADILEFLKPRINVKSPTPDDKPWMARKKNK